MVGSWIPAATDLARKGKVLAVARAGKISRHEATGLLIDLWGYISECCTNGFMESVVLEDLASLIGGSLEFWSAVAGIGWIIVEDFGLRVPDNEDHPWIENGAKARLMNARRQAKHRAKDVIGNADALRTVTPPPLPEKEKEKEINRDLSQESHSPDLEFDSAAVPIASKLYEATQSSKENDPFLWQVAVLALRGAVSQAKTLEAAESCLKATGDRVAYFRRCLERHAGGKKSLKALLRRVHLTREFPRGPPDEMPMPFLAPDAIFNKLDQ
jgi:hypothetical protein